jgi:hypothetical protein
MISAAVVSSVIVAAMIIAAAVATPAPSGPIVGRSVVSTVVGIIAVVSVGRSNGGSGREAYAPSAAAPAATVATPSAAIAAPTAVVAAAAVIAATTAARTTADTVHAAEAASRQPAAAMCRGVGADRGHACKYRTGDRESRRARAEKLVHVESPVPVLNGFGDQQVAIHQGLIWKLSPTA